MRVSRLVLAIIAALVIIAAVTIIWFFASSGSGEASQPVTAPTLAVTVPPTQTATPAAGTLPASVEITPGTTEAPAAEATAAAAAGAADPVLFSLVQDESSISFELDEDMRGQRVTVIGRSPDVAGQVAVDFDNPSASQVGQIVFNLRTLDTGNDFRNRAIRGQILQSARDEFEFGSFTPTAITGLPTTSIASGQTVTFQITGDLTLRDITRPVTFDVTLTEASEERLVGQATATVNRNDWGLAIPDVPGIANVEEEVVLTLVIAAVPG